jgi:hypothetical protein
MSVARSRPWSPPRSAFAGFRFPRGDHGGGALVPALRTVLPRRRRAARRTQHRGRSRHGPYGCCSSSRRYWPTPPVRPPTSTAKSSTCCSRLAGTPHPLAGSSPGETPQRPAGSSPERCACRSDAERGGDRRRCGRRLRENILGVDTHQDTHVASVITILGVLVATAAFPSTAAGCRQLLGWARNFGVVHRAGVEGSGSYGAALARSLRRQHIAVIEVNRPDRAARRRHGNSDTLDATAAAHAVLSARATSTATTGDAPVEMLRIFRLPGPPRSRPAPRRSTNSRPSSSAPTRPCTTPGAG